VHLQVLCLKLVNNYKHRAVFCRGSPIAFVSSSQVNKKISSHAAWRGRVVQSQEGTDSSSSSHMSREHVCRKLQTGGSNSALAMRGCQSQVEGASEALSMHARPALRLHVQPVPSNSITLEVMLPHDAHCILQVLDNMRHEQNSPFRYMGRTPQEVLDDARQTVHEMYTMPAPGM
jgi:hypothetical protein